MAAIGVFCLLFSEGYQVVLMNVQKRPGSPQCPDHPHMPPRLNPPLTSRAGTRTLPRLLHSPRRPPQAILPLRSNDLPS